MWPDTPIEKKLIDSFGVQQNEYVNASLFITDYNSIKSYMTVEVYPNIGRIEPDLTDHGAEHIQDVLRNAYALLDNNIGDEYTPIELCVLCMSILVHDIGNLYGREGHEQTIINIFKAGTFPSINAHLRRIIIRVAQAHGGKGDTIQLLGEKAALSSKPIRISCIAAVLRFADELAEGPHRTSRLMLEEKMISEGSVIYHEYAKLTNPPCIDSDSIVLDFNISIKGKDEESLKELISFVFKRVYKLNRERIYCGLYSVHVQRIKNVNISISFYEDDDQIEAIEIPNELTNFRLTNLECSEFNQLKENSINKIMTYLTNEKRHKKAQAVGLFQRFFK